MEENNSGADLEEAHFYHTLKEFSALVNTYGWDYIEKKLLEIDSANQSGCKSS